MCWNFRLIAVVILIAICLSGQSAEARSQQRSNSKAGIFAYYSLVLSWSPTYCATRKKGRAEPQCDAKRSYAFVLHGLWPQYKVGWPQQCRVANRWVPRNVINAMMDIMPSRGLIIHEWRKHGTCSGLGASAYFKTARQLFQQIKIPARYLHPNNPIVTSPAQIETDFLKTNPNITADMIAISCGRKKRLKDVRICFGRDLRPTNCGVNEKQRRLCRPGKIVMPPVR